MAMAGRIYSSLRKVMPPPLMRRRCFLGFTQKRAFGAAAAAAAAALPAVQYDYEEEEEGSRRTLVPIPMEDCEGCFPRRGGVQWVFIGSPGSKKHLYAERLSKLLQVPHISMATLVRQELNPRSSLYTQIADAVNQGKVVPEDIITFGLLSKRLLEEEEGHSKGETTGFILDGIPRTQIQAEILDEIADIDLVVNFKCAEQCLVNKHLITRFCSHATEVASSDTKDVRKEKLWVYAEQRKALEDYYKKQKKLLDFQVSGGPGETWQGLLAALHLKHMNAIHSSHLVT